MPLFHYDQGYIYYEQHGKGKDLVLISGFAADHTTWSEMINSLSQQYRVLVFDNPGIGRSYTPIGFYSLETMCQEITLLFDHLNINSSYFMGHSMGSALLMLLCLHYPKRVSKALLCGGFATLPMTARLQTQGFQFTREKGFSADYISLSLLPWLFGRTFLSDQTKVTKLLEAFYANPYPQTLAGFLVQAKALLNFDVSQSLQNITTPCLIVTSDEDLLIPMHATQLLVKSIPDANLHIIREGVGHMLHIEEPHQLQQLTARFLSP